MTAFRFRKKTDYGLKMLAMLSESDEQYLSVAKMEDKGMPRSFLVKIAQELIKAEIIGSKEGRGGGYYLKKKPENITVKEVLEVLEGKVGMNECVVHEGACPLASTCKTRRVYMKMSGEIERVLSGYAVVDLC